MRFVIILVLGIAVVQHCYGGTRLDNPGEKNGLRVLRQTADAEPTASVDVAPPDGADNPPGAPELKPDVKSAPKQNTKFSFKTRRDKILEKLQAKKLAEATSPKPASKKPTKTDAKTKKSQFVTRKEKKQQLKAKLAALKAAALPKAATTTSAAKGTAKPSPAGGKKKFSFMSRATAAAKLGLKSKSKPNKPKKKPPIIEQMMGMGMKGKLMGKGRWKGMPGKPGQRWAKGMGDHTYPGRPLNKLDPRIMKGYKQGTMTRLGGFRRRLSKNGQSDAIGEAGTAGKVKGNASPTRQRPPMPGKPGQEPEPAGSKRGWERRGGWYRRKSARAGQHASQSGSVPNKGLGEAQAPGSTGSKSPSDSAMDLKRPVSGWRRRNQSAKKQPAMPAVKPAAKGTKLPAKPDGTKKLSHAGMSGWKRRRQQRLNAANKATNGTGLKVEKKVAQPTAKSSAKPGSRKPQKPAVTKTDEKPSYAGMSGFQRRRQQRLDAIKKARKGTPTESNRGKQVAKPATKTAAVADVKIEAQPPTTVNAWRRRGGRR